jgi:hypothetical protein
MQKDLTALIIMDGFGIPGRNGTQYMQQIPLILTGIGMNTPMWL